MFNVFTRSGNLLQNPSFESGLSYWNNENVTLINTSPSEGTQAASLGPGVASLSQDVLLGTWLRKPLFMSFVAYTLTGIPGDLIATVYWLDSNGIIIGTGLKALIPSSAISTARITFIDITERPPINAQWARLLFSAGAADEALVLDLINLAPVETPNLLRNPSFELGLEGWDASSFTSNFTTVFEGAASAAQIAEPGTLSQNLLLRPILPGTSYLLSFAATSTNNAAVTAQLFWLNILGNPIGAPAINAPIVASTLAGQGAYLNLMQASDPAPLGTFGAQLILSTAGAPGSIFLDQVNMIRLLSPNLLQNPGFIQGLDFWTTQGVIPQNTGGFVGDNFALLADTGAVINQTVSLPRGSGGGSFLLNFALHFSGTDALNGNVIAQVHWLNCLGQEIGIGLALVIAQETQERAQWQSFTRFTEKVPVDAISARIQFTKSAGGDGSDIGLDSVIFARVV